MSVYHIFMCVCFVTFVFVLHIYTPLLCLSKLYVTVSNNTFEMLQCSLKSCLALVSFDVTDFFGWSSQHHAVPDYLL